MKHEKYQPSKEEIKKAEEMMTDEQKEVSEKREQEKELFSPEFIQWRNNKDRGFLFPDNDSRDGYIIISHREDDEEDYTPKWVWGFQPGSELSIEELKALKEEAVKNMPEAIPLIDEKISFFENEGAGEYKKLNEAKILIKSLEVPTKKEDTKTVEIENESIYRLLRNRINELLDGNIGSLDDFRNSDGTLKNPQIYGSEFDEGFKAWENRTHNGSRYYVNVPSSWASKIENINF